VRRPGKDTAAVLGVGAVACLACCAPVIAGFLGGLTLAGLASSVVLGTAGLIISVFALAALLLVMRRRRTSSCAVNERIAVGAPTRRGS
jgi:hypothetical protein